MPMSGPLLAYAYACASFYVLSMLSEWLGRLGWAGRAGQAGLLRFGDFGPTVTQIPESHTHTHTHTSACTRLRPPPPPPPYTHHVNEARCCRPGSPIPRLVANLRDVHAVSPPLMGCYSRCGCLALLQLVSKLGDHAAAQHGTGPGIGKCGGVLSLRLRGRDEGRGSVSMGAWVVVL